MATAQNRRDTTPSADSSTRLATLIRQRHAGYDNWTLQDLRRLDADDVNGILSSAGSIVDWYPLIPQNMRTQYGDQAPRLFMSSVFDRVKELGLVDAHMPTVLETVIKRSLNLSSAEASRLVLDRPVSVLLTNGEVITTTPSQAMFHVINQAIMRPDASLAPVANQPLDRPFMTPLAGIIALPNSLLDAIISQNPALRTRLETLRGKAIFPISPEIAYEAGQIAQIRGTNNIVDWSLKVTDPAMICPNVTAIENDVYDRQPNDARLDESWNAGNIRASNACPLMLGNLSAPPPPATRSPARVAMSGAFGAF